MPIVATCPSCARGFSSKKSCHNHVKNNVCIRRETRRFARLKSQMCVCPRCSIVLSSEHSLRRHLGRKTPCPIRPKIEAIRDSVQNWEACENLRRKKFLLKLEVLREAMSDMEKTELEQADSLLQWITVSPLAGVTLGSDSLQSMTKQELMSMVKEQAASLERVRKWVSETQTLLRTVLGPNFTPPATPRSENNQGESKEPMDRQEAPKLKMKSKNKKPVKKSKKVKKPVKKSKKVKKPVEEDTGMTVETKRIAEHEREKRISREQNEWNAILKEEDKKFGPMTIELSGVWNPENYILKPVRHYADCYSRKLMIRNMNSAKMLSSLINPYFYPNYRSNYATRIYGDAKNPDKAWLRDDDGKWHYMSFKDAAKNMIFHAVSAYVDLLRREREILHEEDWCAWRQEQHTLENSNCDNYKIVIKNIQKRIPKLSCKPDKEECRIASIFLQSDDRKMETWVMLENEIPDYDTLSLEEQEEALWRRIIYDLRHQDKIKRAQTFHKQVPSVQERLNDVDDEPIISERVVEARRAALRSLKEGTN